MPLGGEPVGLIPRIEAYDAWLADSADGSKLLMTFEGSPTQLIDSRLTGRRMWPGGTSRSRRLPKRDRKRDRRSGLNNTIFDATRGFREKQLRAKGLDLDGC